MKVEMIRKPLMTLSKARQVLVAICISSAAQVVHAQTYLPSMKIMQGSLIAPANADSFYGNATGHSISVPGFSRPTEVTQLAEGLGASLVTTSQLTADAYAQRVFQYIYSNIQNTFMFGVQKGALGTILDQSGTAFDQAQLMNELLKVAGISAVYNYGTITLNGTQFYNWTGITNAASACRLLADGGIPASINGSSSSVCSYTGNVSSVTLSHIWVAADIAGTTKLYDPSRLPVSYSAA